MKTDPYITAHNDASAMLKRGEILAFSCEYVRGEGRTISVESDQGYDPVPFYSDVQFLGDTE